MPFLIKDTIKENKNQIIKFCQDLVRIPTQNPPKENYTKLVERIKKELDNQFNCKIYSKNNKPNLVVKWNVGGKKTIHINSHYDVVPAKGNWKTEPFDPKIINNKIYGRGAADCKSNICVSIYAVKLMKKLALKPASNVELSFTCDEESGGFDGMGFLVKNKLIKPDYAIVADGPTEGINNAHKGALALNITVIGKPSHAGWPHRGKNAFITACKLAEKLDELNLKYKHIKSKCDTKEEIEKHPSIVVGGKAEGGAKFNQVNGEFSFTIDRRIIPEENMKNVKNEILKVINEFKAKNKEFTIRTEDLLEAKPSFTSKNSKISQVLSDAIKKVSKKKPDFYLFPAFLDMRYIVNDLKTECVNYGTKGANQHGDNEYVEIDSIFENIEVFIELLLDKRLNS